MEYVPAKIDNAAIVSVLRWYVDSGVDESGGDETVDYFARSGLPVIQGKPDPVAPDRQQTRITPALLPVGDIARAARQQAAACTDLAELQQMIANFDGCRLKKTATHTVFADGNPDSDIMVIGDLPGAREDRLGKPFAGESGQLLDRMFAAIGLERAQDFYLTNILPWRPPGNRSPTSEEITICLPFIERHIALFNPGLIILLGGPTDNNLLGSTASITRLRGKWQRYDLQDRKIPLRTLFHPAYLLKQPRAKGNTWQDLLAIKAKAEEVLS
ncbi:MAG: uracil-DNA glycosylase [Alphaproteobacteria bacterium]|nr:uracil-DNA glycosylase [Alphaproteobacteria bacterium]